MSILLPLTQELNDSGYTDAFYDGSGVVKLVVNKHTVTVTHSDYRPHILLVSTFDCTPYFYMFTKEIPIKTAIFDLTEPDSIDKLLQEVDKHVALAISGTGVEREWVS